MTPADAEVNGKERTVGKWQTALTIGVLVAVAVGGRLLPHMPNFAPVTATALFCGAYLSRRQSFFALGAVLLLSDYLLLYINPYGRSNFDQIYAPWELWHSALPYVYVSFAISAVVGWWVKSRRSSGLVIAAALFCSIQFFLITNAGVWIGGMYDRGLDGLLQSYTMALPFFRGTVLGDLFYTSAFFGAFELASGFAQGFRRRLPAPAV
jgi:hypothetical protein